MDLGQYWQEMLLYGTPIMGILIAGGIKYIKNKLAGNVVASTLLKIEENLGKDEYNALTNIVKNIGVKKVVEGITAIVGKLDDVNAIIPLIVAMSRTHLNLGVYDESPELKEIVEKTLDNVE